MADVWRTLKEVGERVRQVTVQIPNIADHVGKSVSGAAGRETSARQRTLYTEAAEACEGVNDALLREEGGTTAKMTKVAAVKLGAIGTSAGIFGVAATVGTASTGTAIGVLSGAAATSATLAWVGGIYLWRRMFNAGRLWH